MEIEGQGEKTKGMGEQINGERAKDNEGSRQRAREIVDEQRGEGEKLRQRGRARESRLCLMKRYAVGVS